MSKSDLSWILVKLLGAILLYFGIASIYGAFVGWMSVREGIEALTESRRGNVLAPVRALCYGALLPLTLGIYLLVSGRLLHRLLLSVPASSMEYSQVPGAIPGIDLPEEELKQFKIWIERNPEYARRPQVDQVALFRDAQAEGKV